MNPPPAKGKARRKPCTEKPSARFDEEREVGRPLFYSTLSKLSISSGWVSLIFLWIAAIISYKIFQRFPYMKIAPKKIAPSKDILFRCLFGGSTVAAVVILGDSAGYLWGGLFSSFPGTITPVLVLLHLKNGKEMSYSVIKSSPIGLSATGLYSCIVWVCILYTGYSLGHLYRTWLFWDFCISLRKR